MNGVSSLPDRTDDILMPHGSMPTNNQTATNSGLQNRIVENPQEEEENHSDEEFTDAREV